MTRYTAFAAGLAGIALFLSIIVVVSEDVPSTGSPAFNTTKPHNDTTVNRTEPFPTSEIPQQTNHKMPIIQLSETDQQLEELLLTTQNHSSNLEDEGSGEEPISTSVNESVTTNSSISLASDITTQAMAEAEESQKTTPGPFADVASVVYYTTHNTSENISTLGIPMTESTTSETTNQLLESPPTTVATVPENVTETTNVSVATTDNETLSTTRVPEIENAGATTTLVPESTTQQPESTTDIQSSSLPITTFAPININGTSQGRSMDNFDYSQTTELRLDSETTEDTSSTAFALPSVSHASLVTSKEETNEYPTQASAIVEHYVTTEGKIHTTMPQPITLTHQSSTPPSLTIGASNVSETTTKEYFETEITTKPESVSQSSTLSVTIPDTEAPTTTKMSTGAPSPVPTISNTIEQNETSSELPTNASSAATDFQATEISTEMTTPPQSKCYDKLSEPEFFNSVTIVFSRPSRMKGMLFDRETFKENVICLMNMYELQGWPLTVLNLSDCNEVNMTLESKLLSITDLAFIEPSPTLNNNEIIVSFFTRNTTAKYSGQIVSRNRTLIVLNNHKEYLMNQMGMNISDIYAGMRISHLVSPTIDPFYMRHSLLLIILAVVAGVCILIIISGLIYIKCRNTKSKWSSTSSYTQEKSKLQGDMLCSEMGQHLNSDDDINKDETLRAINNGNGFFTADTGSGSSVTPIGDEEGWVIPYDELSPEEKSSVEVEDTKL